MRKKLLAGLIAVPMTLAALVGLTGCDFIDAITGSDSSNNPSQSGGNKGGQVSEEQWETVFGDPDHYNNYTTEVSGKITMTEDGKTEKRNARGQFLVADHANYTQIEIYGSGSADENYIMEMYGYQTSAHNYTWVRFNDSGEWEREEVNGLPLSNIMLADYTDCYNCFEYNSSTKRYEATKSGLEPLLDVMMNSANGEMPIDNVTLNECSFAISNGVPVSASMQVTMVTRGEKSQQVITQTIEYSFSNYGKTSVKYPTQIENELKELNVGGDDDPTPGKPSDGPVKPGDVTGDVTGDKINENNWMNIFEDFNKSANFTADMYMDLSMTSSSVVSTTIINQKVYSDGSKTHNAGTTYTQTTMTGQGTESDSEYVESYGWMNGDKYYAWTRSENNNSWHFSEINVEEVNSEDIIFSEDYSEFYKYVIYNSKTGAYEVNRAGLDILNESIGAALSKAYAGSGMAAKGEIVKYEFVIKDGMLHSISMLFEMQLRSSGYVFDVTEDIAVIFSNVGKTTVKYPSYIQEDVNKIQAGGKPSSGDNNEPTKPENPNRPGENEDPVKPVNPDLPVRPDDVFTETVNNSQWRKAFDCLTDKNYTLTAYNENVADTVGVMLVDGNKYKMTGFYRGDVEVELWQYRNGNEDLTWFNIDGNWEKDEKGMIDRVNDPHAFIVEELATLYKYKTLNEKAGCYEIDKGGLALLSEAISVRLDDTVTITSCSVVIQNGVVYSVKIEGVSMDAISYYFSDVGDTVVEIPAIIRRALRDMGINP